MEIDIEDYKFLWKLGREIKNQDNRGTAKPYFYVVRTEDVLVAPEGFGQGDTVRFWHGDESRLFKVDEKEDFIKFYTENGYEGDPEEKWELLETFGQHEVQREDNVFLTKKAYDEHIKLNGHNYSEPRSYVKHAFRNPEMKRLIEILIKIGSLDIEWMDEE